MSIEVELDSIDVLLNDSLQVEINGAQLPCNSTINVSNSDDSYSVNVNSDLELPDIIVTDSDGSISSFPSVKDVVCTPAVSLPNSYCYPILSQTTSYRTGDEGWQIANVWNSIYGAIDTRKSVIGLTDFYTLDANNQFGNTARYTDLNGVPLSTLPTNGNKYRDNYLGLYLYRIVRINLSWNNAIDTSRTEDDGSWYLPGFDLLLTLKDWENNNDFELNDYVPSSSQWTSTTNPKLTTEGQRVIFSNLEANYPQILVSNNKELYNAGYGLLYKPIT